jgi:hypothetical protein
MSALSYPEVSLRTRSIVAKSIVGDIACFVIPAFAFLRVEVGGVLYATDLCLLGALLFVVARHRRWLKIKPVQITMWLGLLWLAAQVLTDVIRQSPVEDYSRGWSKILLTVTHFAAIALLVRQSQRRFILYGAGLALGGVLTFFLAPSEFGADVPWKFGVGLPVTVLVCLIAGMIAPRSRVAAATMITAIGAVNVYLNFRSLGAVCAASAIYSYFQLSSQFADKRLRKLQTVLAVAGLAAAVWSISAIYAHGVQRGWFGEEALQKYEMQSSGDAGILLGGRNEFLAASSAIRDSPVIGHGSWAKDPKYKAILYDRLAELGYRHMGPEVESDLIPSHSHLLGAWVESGIVGAVFWCWVLWLTGSTLARASGREPLFPFFAFIALLLTWNVLFSPYGADQRFTATYFVYAMILFALHSQAQNRPHAYAQSLDRNHLV